MHYETSQSPKPWAKTRLQLLIAAANKVLNDGLTFEEAKKAVQPPPPRPTVSVPKACEILGMEARQVHGLIQAGMVECLPFTSAPQIFLDSLLRVKEQIIIEKKGESNETAETDRRRPGKREVHTAAKANRRRIVFDGE